MTKQSTKNDIIGPDKQLLIFGVGRPGNCVWRRLGTPNRPPPPQNIGSAQRGLVADKGTQKSRGEAGSWDHVVAVKKAWRDGTRSIRAS